MISLNNPVVHIRVRQKNSHIPDLTDVCFLDVSLCVCVKGGFPQWNDFDESVRTNPLYYVSF